MFKKSEINERTIDLVLERLFELKKNRNALIKYYNAIQGGRCLSCREKMLNEADFFNGKKIRSFPALICESCHSKKKIPSHDKLKEFLRDHILKYHNALKEILKQ